MAQVGVISLLFRKRNATLVVVIFTHDNYFFRIAH